MIATPAASITKAASKQTYYTIRFLVDREHVDDAYRAYGYFRWVDDVLDAEDLALTSCPMGSEAVDGYETTERVRFLERQKSLLETCYQGQAPRNVNT